MTFTEQEVRQIITEEIEKILEEENLDEILGLGSFARSLGQKAAAGLGRLSGMTGADYADTASAVEKEKASSAAAAAKKAADSEFMAQTKTATAQKKEVEAVYNKIMGGLGSVEQYIDKLEDYIVGALPAEQGNKAIADLRAAGNMYSQEIEKFTQKILGYSLRESKKKVAKKKLEKIVREEIESMGLEEGIMDFLGFAGKAPVSPTATKRPQQLSLGFKTEGPITSKEEALQQVIGKLDNSLGQNGNDLYSDLMDIAKRTSAGGSIKSNISRIASMLPKGSIEQETIDTAKQAIIDLSKFNAEEE